MQNINLETSILDYSTRVSICSEIYLIVADCSMASLNTYKYCIPLFPVG